MLVSAVSAEQDVGDDPAHSFPLGLGDPGEKVVSDLDEPVALGGAGPEHQAANTGFSELAVVERKLWVWSRQSLDVGSGRRFHALMRLGCPVCVAIQHGPLSGESPGG